MTQLHHILTREIAERLHGYQGPNLSPVGLKLLSRRLADGVYPLIANIASKDNNGVIVGNRASLVVDAGITPYLSSLRQMRDTLPELETSHGPMGDAPSAIEWLIAYLERLHDEVARAFESGRTVDETLAQSTDPWAEGQDPPLAHAPAEYSSTAPRATDGILALGRNLHRLNILATYRMLETAGRSA